MPANYLKGNTYYVAAEMTSDCSSWNWGPADS